MSKNSIYFKASLDRPARMTTVLVTLLFAGIIILDFMFIRKVTTIMSPILILTLLIPYALAYGFSPRGYSISAGEVTIQRLWGKKTFQRDAIRQVDQLDHDDLRYSLRNFGVGGLFGYFGKFSNTRIGAMRWYLKRRDHTVLLRLHNGDKILLSPDDTEAFLQALES